MGKQLVNFITCGCELSAPFFVIYKAGWNINSETFPTQVQFLEQYRGRLWTKLYNEMKNQNLIEVIVERGDTPNTQIHDRSLSCAGTDTSI